MKPSSIVLVLLAACGGNDSRPRFKPEHMPPASKGLVLATSTEAEVLAVAGADAQVSKHEDLGGDGVVAFNDHPSISIRGNGGEFWLWKQHDDVPRLGKLEIRTPAACTWLQDHVGKLDGARNCPGNRKTGVDKSGSSGYFCLSLEDGRVVHADCYGGKDGNGTVSYFVGKKR